MITRELKLQLKIKQKNLCNLWLFNLIGISQLRQFIFYKSDVHGRKYVLVDSKYTTMTYSICGAKTNPTGLDELAVRNWKCSACGAQHNRDINAVKVILNFGLGYNLNNVVTHAIRPEICKLESSGGAR